VSFTSLLVPPYSSTIEDEIDTSGMNLIARWKQQFSENANWMLQLYYDHTDRKEVIIDEARDTVDLEFQHQWQVSERHDLVWGLGYRYTTDDTEGAFNTSMDPEDRDDHLFSAFVQDDIMLISDKVWFTLGTKLEHNDYSDFEIQPSARLRWKPTAQSTLWGSVSRAVRTPSRADHDLRVNLTARPDPQSGMVSVLRVTGDTEFVSEELTAIEAGFRWAPDPIFSLDLAAFYNIYDNYRSLEPGTPFMEFDPAPPHLVIPLVIDNKLDAETHGIEALLTWQPVVFWRLSASYAYLNVSMEPDEDSRDSESQEYERFSPDHQVQVRSYLDLPKNFSLDTMLYLVDEIPYWEVDSYARLDLRLGWDPSANWSFSLTATNLIDSSHLEFGDISGINASKVPSTIFGKVTWNF
jgi:iron complex outermembrane receptor protein